MVPELVDRRVAGAADVRGTGTISPQHIDIVLLLHSVLLVVKD